MTSLQKRAFDNAGFYFIALLALVLLGFWPSYFSKFFDGTADFNFYFHFHSVFAFIWVALIIIQPILIRKKKYALHRKLGSISFLVVPMIFISVMLLAHHRMPEDMNRWGMDLWIPFKDLFIIGVFYGIAIKYRKTVEIHARGMIAAGMALIEPALIRFISNTFFADWDGPPVDYMITLGIIYAIILVLIFKERNHSKGRWVFPLLLLLLLIVHSVIVFQIPIPGWQAFAEWFGGLPIT